MWFKQPSTPVDWSAAEKHLSKSRVGMKKIIATVGPCRMYPRSGYFVILCKSIFAQQLSVKIADILFQRFLKLFPNRRPTPTLVMKALGPKANESKLKYVGLSRQKRAYVLDLARHFDRGEIPVRKFKTMTDDEIVESLTRVNGIGRWTAEMFLIFVLNREDLWPIDDLGLREAVKRLFKLDARPTAKETIAFGEKFKPYRSVATWYLWRSLGQG